MSRAVEVQSLNHWTTRKIPASLNHIYIYIYFFFFFFFLTFWPGLTAYGILVSQQGIEPVSPAVEVH